MCLVARYRGDSLVSGRKGTALWRLRSWSRQRRLLAAPHGQGRGVPLGNALAFAEELDQEGFEGGDTGTVKNDSPSPTVDSPSVVQVEDRRCMGIVVRATQEEVEVAVVRSPRVLWSSWVSTMEDASLYHSNCWRSF